MSQPRLLLADDHMETAELLRGLLEPEFDVIAQVRTATRSSAPPSGCRRT